MVVTLDCKECGKDFELKEVTHKEKYDVIGQTIYLTTFSCPFCGSVHIGQIDTDETLEILESMTKGMKVAIRKKKKNKDISKQSVLVEKAQEDLTNLRNSLMAEFTGKTAVSTISGRTLQDMRFSKW